MSEGCARDESKAIISLLDELRPIKVTASFASKISLANGLFVRNQLERFLNEVPFTFVYAYGLCADSQF